MSVQRYWFGTPQGEWSTATVQQTSILLGYFEKTILYSLFCESLVCVKYQCGVPTFTVSQPLSCVKLCQATNTSVSTATFCLDVFHQWLPQYISIWYAKKETFKISLIGVFSASVLKPITLSSGYFFRNYFLQNNCNKEIPVI